MFNPPSCAARLQQMTMTCGRITNYTRSHCGAQSRLTITTLPKRAVELVLSLYYYCPVMSKKGQVKEANLVEAFLTQANPVAEVSFYIT